jgi:cellulose synthase/poly-beta-1,6-N-acetylglucosamine synthase-like glycosyltransferase
MRVLPDIIEAVYSVTTIGLATYGITSVVNTFLYLRSRKRRGGQPSLQQPEDWPRVTVQLPVFNEKYTVARLVQSVASLDYPRDRLQIQILDDSTDDTAALAGRLAADYRQRGLDVECLHRDNRGGFKAGALSDALASATGDFLAIFDADFLPEPDWLRRTIPMFADASIGCLQTRWGHTNRDYNSLTREEALAIDGHFIVEQTARSRSGLFLNFNGTAGLWRRTCIEDAGGWQPDTLTEDLDLSYRAQLRGWRIEYLPDVVVPAELPAQVEAFKKQQFRWAKGSFQVVRKILPSILRRRDLPLRVRLMAVLHLTGYMVHPLMLLMLLLTLPTGLEAPLAFHLMGFAFIAGFGPPIMYLVAAEPSSPPLRERFRLIPLMLLTGFGISLSTAIAVFEGLLGRKAGDWKRTPKLNLGNAHKSGLIDRTYLEPLSPIVWMEIGLAVYALATALILPDYVGWEIVPWMLIYALGYSYIAGLNILQHAPEGARRPPRPSLG